VEQQVAEIVDICTLSKCCFAKNAVLRHVQNHHRLAAIAVVLGHHVSEAGRLNRLDQISGIFNRRCGNNFTQHMLARVQRVYSLSSVQHHKRGQKHGVHRWIPQDVFVTLERFHPGSLRYPLFSNTLIRVANSRQRDQISKRLKRGIEAPAAVAANYRQPYWSVHTNHPLLNEVVTNITIPYVLLITYS
jgi:hypothetical protein